MVCCEKIPVDGLSVNPLWFVLILLILFAVVSGMDMKDEMKTEANYCEMVSLYKSSNGQYGWPDYKGNFKTNCLNR